MYLASVNAIQRKAALVFDFVFKVTAVRVSPGAHRRKDAKTDLLLRPPCSEEGAATSAAFLDAGDLSALLDGDGIGARRGRVGMRAA